MSLFYYDTVTFQRIITEGVSGPMVLATPGAPWRVVLKVRSLPLVESGASAEGRTVWERHAVTGKLSVSLRILSCPETFCRPGWPRSQRSASDRIRGVCLMPQKKSTVFFFILPVPVWLIGQYLVCQVLFSKLRSWTPLRFISGLELLRPFNASVCWCNYLTKHFMYWWHRHFERWCHALGRIYKSELGIGVKSGVKSYVHI